MTQDNPLMEHSIVCPKCGSNQVEKRNHENKTYKKLAEVLLGSAGTAAGTVGGAASGASLGGCHRHRGRTVGGDYGRYHWYLCGCN